MIFDKILLLSSINRIESKVFYTYFERSYKNSEFTSKMAFYKLHIRLNDKKIYLENKIIWKKKEYVFYDNVYVNKIRLKEI